ncbi:helix-turn-helix domain-containing protein [Thalassobius aquimarinus]|uniref:Helix-turn-helix domain-containing protein n=2 Tax=Thalassovita aquimarina TaxID=2785917 RepID=A0ABS5HVV0_9RHOB|nr:helix-turn-helix domain-containing protein [Thalassovita aquimarina]
MTNAMQNAPKSDQNIALVDYPGAQAAALYGLSDLFKVANRYAEGQGRIVVTTVADPVAQPFDAFLFPPNLEGARGAPDHPLVRWAADQHRRGARACSVCAGAFWLGHAGLLDGRSATTHWALEDEFRDTFPTARLFPELILVDDHDIVTAGGLMAWLDLGLFLVGLWGGPHLVSQVSRHLLVDPSGREQRNYRSFRPRRQHGEAAILQVQTWLETRVGDAVTVDDMAAHAGLSARTFLRRFQAATGLSPSAYLQQLRVEKARGLLERSRLPVSQIAWDVGYADPSAFARVFKAVTGLSAGDYRRRFGLRGMAQRG